MSWAYGGGLTHVTHPYATRKTDHQTRLTIAQRYQSGASMAQISREQNLSVPTVRRILRDQGVQLRHHRGRGKPFGGPT